jgi:hypothetical protein
MNDSGIVATPLGLATFPFSPENCYGSQILEESYANKMGKFIYYCQEAYR